MSNIDYRPELEDGGTPLATTDGGERPYYYISPEIQAKLRARAMEQVEPAEKTRERPVC